MLLVYEPSFGQLLEIVGLCCASIYLLRSMGFPIALQWPKPKHGVFMSTQKKYTYCNAKFAVKSILYLSYVHAKLHQCLPTFTWSVP